MVDTKNTPHRDLQIVLAIPGKPTLVHRDSIVTPLAASLLQAGYMTEIVSLDSSETDTTLVALFTEHIIRREQTNIAIGGFSLGARIAVMVSQSLSVNGVLAMGFPFHRRGAPLDRHGLHSLSQQTTPTLLMQGTRDNHGSESECRGYPPLPSCVQMHWVPNANHRWHSPANSAIGFTHHLQMASLRSLQFLETLVSET